MPLAEILKSEADLMLVEPDETIIDEILGRRQDDETAREIEVESDATETDLEVQVTEADTKLDKPEKKIPVRY